MKNLTDKKIEIIKKMLEEASGKKVVLKEQRLTTVVAQKMASSGIFSKWLDELYDYSLSVKKDLTEKEFRTIVGYIFDTVMDGIDSKISTYFVGNHDGKQI